MTQRIEDQIEMTLYGNKIESGSVIRSVLGYYNMEGGWSAGGFETQLIKTICHADINNRLKLSLGFSDYVKCVALIEAYNEAPEYLLGLANLRSSQGRG